MTDEPSDKRDHRSRFGDLDEWITRISESEDVSREEAIERLVSSYWTLKEMHGLMEHSEEGTDGDSESESFGAEALHTTAFESELADLRDRLDRLEEYLHTDAEDVQPEELRADIDSLTEEVTDLQGLPEKHESLRSRVDKEFGNLETVLDYLIETTDVLEEHVESLSDNQEDDRHHRTEHDRLQELKRLASRLGVRKAKCGHCDSRVDLGLLHSPDCPHCGRPFYDIEPSSRWFGIRRGLSVLTVGGRSDADG